MATVLVLLAAAGPALAHELHSAALRLDERSPGVVDVTLKTPLARGGGAPAVVPQFRGGCRTAGEARSERRPDAILRRWRMACDGGLAGKEVAIEGLDPRTPDAVVAARFADGRTLTAAVARDEPSLRLEPARSAGPPPGLLGFLAIGVEHILFGFDHLLFVLGLMLVVRAGGHGLRTLAAAITAFTVAHSLTLALATLGIWGLSPRAVEVLIAASILLLALELATASERGGAPRSLAIRAPALVAFVFGLLHGFGFAGALADVGLPDHARAWALFLFNAGVELGQLLFVAAALSAWTLLRRAPRPAWAGTEACATLLGGVAAYWTLERLLLWAGA